MTCGGVAALADPATAAPSATLVVSEAYGGGNSGATVKNDFVELGNAGSSAADLTGYSVQYLSASPGPTTTWQVSSLSGSVPADGRFLIAEAAGAGGTDPLPTPDATGSINLSGTAGTVALVHSTTALTCKTAGDCAAVSDIADLVGWGGAAVHEGTAAPATTNTTSVQRAATLAPAKQLSIATYNVENLAPTDPQPKFDALAHGVVTNLATPDIVALEEIQDNDGTVDDGVVAADQTLTKLTAAIVAAGGPRYEWREIDPVNDQDGGQPGGNIRVAYLFNPSRVKFVDIGSSKVNRSTTGTQVKVVDGRAQVTLSPGRIDPSNPVWTTSRKPLVGMFRFRGENVFVVANHFDSKSGDQSADGRFQYPAQTSAVQRAGQALVVHNFVQQLRAADTHARVVVVGDLNDYQFSPVLQVLTTGTADASGAAILTDLITTLPLDQQYTYVFNGVSEVLDHILVAPGLGGVRYQVVHVNSEYHDQVSDHDPQVVDITP